MNENQEAIAEEQETVSFDFDDDNSAVVVDDDVSASSEKEETRTIVREDENGADSDDLENYSENVKKAYQSINSKA